MLLPYLYAKTAGCAGRNSFLTSCTIHIMELTCPRCHTTVRSTDFYCYNCGKNLHPPPLQTDTGTLIILFLKTIVLPPLGILWGFKYLRQQDDRSKIVGIAAIVITIIEIILVVQSTVGILNGVSGQLNNFQGMQGF